MSGSILLIDKPAGITSFGVVKKVRWLLKAKKVGHLGTLDPMATGLLPIVIGKATKKADLFSIGNKTYEARIKLGSNTDTYDREGEVLESFSLEGVTEEKVLSELNSFKTTFMQQPPMYSAVKVGGKALYKSARKGVEVERPFKEVTIFSLDDIKIDLPFIEVKVTCSKGTYIRSLAFDLGVKLKTGGHLYELRRTGAGIFDIKDAIPIDLKAEVPGDITKALIPLDDALNLVDKDIREEFENSRKKSKKDSLKEENNCKTTKKRLRLGEFLRKCFHLGTK